MAKNQRNKSFRYVDLFAGCGGFSLGLESEGGELVFALERSPMAAETFMKNLVNPKITDQGWQNHLSETSHRQAQAGLIVGDVTQVRTDPSIRKMLKNSELDLIVGGPPCQGFSLAGRRNVADGRNSLAWDFLSYVELAKPRMVVIENVLGMNSKFAMQEESASSAYSQVADALEQTNSGYVVQKLQLNALHYGAAQNRERLFLVGLRADVAKKLGVHSDGKVWKSNFADVIQNLPVLAPKPLASSDEKLTVQNAIGDLYSNRRVHKYVEILKDANFWGLASTSQVRNKKLRNHGAETTNKFELYLAVKRYGLSTLLLRTGLNEKLEASRSSALREAKNLVEFPIFGTSGEVLASSFSEFEAKLNKFRTRKHSQRVLSLDSIPPTVITSPDDYIHPIYPRVLSVRELARFQGFSDHFIFYSKETTGGLKRRVEVPQYTQVGNAVSPFVSKAIGAMVKSVLARAQGH